MTGNAEQITVWLMRQEDRTILYDIDKHRERRSLDSNAYFHVLCDKLRRKLGVSMSFCKNSLIASYGQIEYLDGDEAVVIKTNIPPEIMLEREYLHTGLVKVSEENGKDVYFYRVYRGSHTYNSLEMTELIKGTVNECKAQDIETATPAELAHMAALWEKKYAKAHENKDDCDT